MVTLKNLALSKYLAPTCPIESSAADIKAPHQLLKSSPQSHIFLSPPHFVRGCILCVIYEFLEKYFSTSCFFASNEFLVYNQGLI